jgi:hypothetical protein
LHGEVSGGQEVTVTRAILDAIHSGELAGAPTLRDPVFGFDVVTACPEVPSEILWPRDTWADKSAFDTAARKLAGLFVNNFKQYECGGSEEVRAASPVAFQFDAQDAPPGKRNYWGYAPVSFFAPHQAYSSLTDALGPLDKFRDMANSATF